MTFIFQFEERKNESSKIGVQRSLQKDVIFQLTSQRSVSGLKPTAVQWSQCDQIGQFIELWVTF